MANLLYLTIDLYRYYLRESLGQNPDEFEKKRQLFAEKLPVSIRFSIIENDNQFETELFKLLGKQKTAPLTLESRDYEGYYYPVQLNDTYGLLLDCSVADQTYPYSVSTIKNLKELIDQNLNNQAATLGETWLIYGTLPNDNSPNQNPEIIAQKCYQALIPNADWGKNLQGKGYFLGGNIFELWQYGFRIPEAGTIDSIDSLPPESIEDNHHIIIAIYPDHKTAEKAADFINDWMCLFCYRSKIIWSNNQSKIIKKYLKRDFIGIQDCIKFLRKEKPEKIHLKKLHKNLEKAENIFSHYAIDITYLNYQTNTIEINLHNYCQCLDTIQKTSASDPSNNDLEFLKKFSQHTETKYLRQLQKDSHNFSKGLELLQVAVNFIRSEVEVDKAQRDHNFQNTVAIVGVGLAAGSLVASLDKLGEAPNDPIRSVLATSLPEPKPWWFEPAIPLVYGIGAAIIAAALTSLVIRLWPRSR
ncbi:hypothetical protein [Brasilonema sp. UFV-L1]|uniref:hypothetical protein n=1 Tax=Brasilonema sp. UFV-L1 TaxID=2234130 RepID=UPI00145CA6BC|nr:hypothetical protein [Brasilonema sp. UFV-L1]NMG09786.1 hypothetical protein [Brasilonema sp. UFV-L1]